MEEKKDLCPACGAEMELKLKNFSIGADGGGGLLTLLATTYVVDLYECPHCGKVELYTAGANRNEEKPADKEVICPVCGTRHSSLIGCPHCALNAAQSGCVAQPKKPKGKKPPWEK